MVGGVDSQPLKTQRIQNSDSEAETDILHITNCLRNVIWSQYSKCWSYLMFDVAQTLR